MGLEKTGIAGTTDELEVPKKEDQAVKDEPSSAEKKDEEGGEKVRRGMMRGRRWGLD